MCYMFSYIQVMEVKHMILWKINTQHCPEGIYKDSKIFHQLHDKKKKKMFKLFLKLHHLFVQIQIKT